MALTWSNDVLVNAEFSLKDTLANGRPPQSGDYGQARSVKVFVKNRREAA